ncbi:MAG: hypothetical protein AAGF66_10345, partial [Cyanobacteria bacterium P01_H01_bin.119]
NPSTHSSWERYEIFDFLKQKNISQEYIINHMNWGTYLISALYGGKDQLVTYAEPMDRETAREIIEVSNMTGRKIACVCRGQHCSPRGLSEYFGKDRTILFEDAKINTKKWKVYLEVSKDR